MNILALVSGHITSCPRAVKFADALSGAGHRVKVVSAPTLPEVVPLDEALVAQKPWRHEACPVATKPMDRAMTKVSSLLWALGSRHRVAVDWCGGATYGTLRQAMHRQSDVDLVLAFNLPALAVALELNTRLGWPYHFDAEDDHVGMLAETPDHESERNRRKHLVRRGVSCARTLTSAAPMMSERLAARHGRTFHTILNVFDPDFGPERSIDDCTMPLKFTWHSQTIGPDRGLEQFLSLLAYVPDAELHLRGKCTTEYRTHLLSVATSAGLTPSTVRFLDLLPANELIGSLAGFDIGLAIEIVTAPNRSACLSNKIFEYLAAGKPIVLSDTPAQAELSKELGDAALLIDLFSPETSGPRIREWSSSRRIQELARRRAQELARNRFNWRIESEMLVNLVTAEGEGMRCVS